MSYNSHDSSNQQRATFIRRTVIVVIACVTIIGAIVLVIWLVLRPQVPDFRVDTLNLSNFNTSSNSLISGNWDARLTVRNPNSKATLYYEGIKAAVFYKDNPISKTTVPPFVQGKKNETAVRVTFASLSAYVHDVDGMNRERAGGTVNFDMMMMARVRFRAGAWSRRRILKIYCLKLSIRVSVNSAYGSLIGGSKNCRVDL